MIKFRKQDDPSQFGENMDMDILQLLQQISIGSRHTTVLTDAKQLRI